MDALKKSIASKTSTKGKKPRKASAGQKERLLPIEGKKPAAKKATKPERSTRRKVGWNKDGFRRCQNGATLKIA